MEHPTHNLTLIYLSIILLAAILAMTINKLKQPAVLGQILIGTMIAIFAHYNISIFSNLIHDKTLSFLAELGSIFLLFEIGLESDINEIKHAGKHASIVAITGVIIPFIAGFYLLTPLISNQNSSSYLALFLGSMLAVTSTGISVSVFKDMGILKHKSSQIVLAASIIDDISGLILLSIITSLVTIGQIKTHDILLTLSYIIIFFILSYISGKYILPNLIKKFISKISVSHETLLLVLIVICIAFSITASLIGLATIIGAFIAGLLLDDKTFHKFDKTTHISHTIAPIGKFLIPIFFIYAGMQVDIVAAMNFATIKLALLISLFAILTKVISGIFLPKTINRWIVGFGMVPRGEIGIIFALIGLEYKIIDNNIFTAILLMVIITSIITPIMINYVYKKNIK